MQELEAFARLFVDPIVHAAIYITTTVLDLKEQELTVRRQAPVTGNAAKGHIDYLIKGPQVCVQAPPLLHTQSSIRICDAVSQSHIKSS